MPPSTRLKVTMYSVSAVAAQSSGSRSTSLSMDVLLDQGREDRCGGDRLPDRIRLARERQGEVSEHAAPDVVDPAVNELEPHVVRGQGAEHVGLRDVSVANGEGDDAAGMPIA